MSIRGRGTLEVKQSNNPFHQTTASDIGVRPAQRIQWTGNADPAMKCNSHNHSDTFSFLYTRESDKIGAMVSKPALGHKRLLTKTEFLKNRREELQSTQTLTQEDIALLNINNQEISQPNVEEILKVFKQGTKYEDPRYTTSNGEYGRKAPTIATLVSERASIPQGFSSSFQNVKPKNSALNTALSKSTVHPKLDPSFA